MSIRLARAGLSGLAIALIPLSESTAHEIVGNRFFPATLGIDDPGVNDELSLPTVDSVQDRRHSTGTAARYFRRIFQTDHRGFRNLVRPDLYASLRPMDPTASRRQRIPEPRDHVQIPGVQEP